ncbi:hypothetical protein ACWD62_43660 [Streptomyces sp. NPDC005146]
MRPNPRTGHEEQAAGPQEAIHRTSPLSLESDVRAWVSQWNENSTPFTWTETADEILDSLARSCQRISGAGDQ